MTKIIVAELIGDQLDYWVARAEGLELQKNLFTEGLCWSRGGLTIAKQNCYLPSSVWSQGGPIIERERIGLENPSERGKWRANSFALSIKTCAMTNKMYGPTPLVAAMRCFVASKFGPEFVPLLLVDK